MSSISLHVFDLKTTKDIRSKDGENTHHIHLKFYLWYRRISDWCIVSVIHIQTRLSNVCLSVNLILNPDGEMNANIMSSDICHLFPPIHLLSSSTRYKLIKKRCYETNLKHFCCIQNIFSLLSFGRHGRSLVCYTTLNSTSLEHHRVLGFSTSVSNALVFSILFSSVSLLSSSSASHFSRLNSVHPK